MLLQEILRVFKLHVFQIAFLVVDRDDVGIEEPAVRFQVQCRIPFKDFFVKGLIYLNGIVSTKDFPAWKSPSDLIRWISASKVANS